MTLQEFAPIFAALSTQLRATDADEITIRAYFAVLQDLEPELVAMAAQRLARSAEWFPKTSEWRAAAFTVERDRSEELRARLRKLSAPMCRACGDTTWEVSDGRAARCACAKRQRLEILGRRPMPELPEAPYEPDAEAAVRLKTMAKQLAEGKSWS